jgi:hypothetical protein
MKSGSLRHPWLSLTDTFQNGDSFTEMGIGMFGTTCIFNTCHPRGDLIEDLSLIALDSRSDTSGMTY